MILVDTSIWVDHLRSADPELARALEQGLVATHPFVVGEIACGSLSNRAEVIQLLSDLLMPLTATDSEALAFIESRSLMGRGLGYIDVHLLAAAALSPGMRLWTRDRRLDEVAAEHDLAFAGQGSGN